MRLWVNGQLIINNWTDHAATEDRGTISLTAGQRYTIRMEFFENVGNATARLLWSSASTPQGGGADHAAVPAIGFQGSGDSRTPPTIGVLHLAGPALAVASGPSTKLRTVPSKVEGRL